MVVVNAAKTSLFAGWLPPARKGFGLLLLAVTMEMLKDLCMELLVPGTALEADAGMGNLLTRLHPVGLWSMIWAESLPSQQISLNCAWLRRDPQHDKNRSTSSRSRQKGREGRLVVLSQPRRLQVRSNGDRQSIKYLQRAPDLFLV
jgi:hypothetical protein